MPSRRHIRPAVGWLARRGRERAESLLPGRHRAASIPPRRLRHRVGAPDAAEFAAGGVAAARALDVALSGGFAATGSVLDFGCGAARVLPHVAALMPPPARGVGIDVDAAAIEWAAAAHPELAFLRGAARPPLPEAARGPFDCVYAISVFSHLPEGAQDAWLAALAAATAPDGCVLLSVHGASAFDAFRTGAARTSWCDPAAFSRGPIAADEFVYVPYERTAFNAAELPGVGDSFGLAFHGAEYVREHWSRWVAVEQIRPRAISDWQDLVVCRPIP